MRGICLQWLIDFFQWDAKQPLHLNTHTYYRTASIQRWQEDWRWETSSCSVFLSCNNWSYDVSAWETVFTDSEYQIWKLISAHFNVLLHSHKTKTVAKCLHANRRCKFHYRFLCFVYEVTVSMATLTVLWKKSITMSTIDLNTPKPDWPVEDTRCGHIGLLVVEQLFFQILFSVETLG